MKKIKVVKFFVKNGVFNVKKVIHRKKVTFDNFFDFVKFRKYIIVNKRKGSYVESAIKKVTRGYLI